jgi:chorismate-pyruvate lyase
MESTGKKIKNDTYDLIKQTEKKYGVELSSIQKILCSLGPIGSPLSAIYGPLNLFVLKQDVRNSTEEETKLLGMDKDCEIIYREVIVFKGGRPLFYALSLIPTGRIKDTIKQALLDEKITIDKIIFDNDIETIRDITNLVVEKPTPILKELFKTSDDMLRREYTISHHEKVMLWSREIFPLIYFK